MKKVADITYANALINSFTGGYIHPDYLQM